jgi:type I restriction enzyme S subunit
MISGKLKNALLMAAIKGDLTTRDKSDGDARDLLESKKDEKEITFEKNPIEFSFEIPDNWVWTKLGCIGTTNIGLTYKPSDVSETGTLVLRSSNIQEGKLAYNDNVYVAIDIPKSKLAIPGDLLICARNGSKRLVGKTAIIDSEGMSFGAFMALLRTPFFKYVYYYLSSPYFRSDFEGVSTTTINQITQSNLKNRLIPLPPIEEQKRIVEKLDEILPLIDELEKDEVKLKDLMQKFPETMKASILQAAIQGKLSNQSVEDGTTTEIFSCISKDRDKLIKEAKIKKVKMLPKITDSEIPFNIPENWTWARLGDCCTYSFSGKSPKYSKIPNSNIAIGQRNNQNYGIDFTNLKYCTDDFIAKYSEIMYLQDYDILLNTLGGGSVGRLGLYLNPQGFKCISDGHLFVFRSGIITFQKYLSYVLKAYQKMIEKDAEGSTNQMFLKLENVRSYLIPVPPLAEQQRIVDKLDRVLPIVKKLSNE